MGPGIRTAQLHSKKGSRQLREVFLVPPTALQSVHINFQMKINSQCSAESANGVPQGLKQQGEGRKPESQENQTNEGGQLLTSYPNSRVWPSRPSTEVCPRSLINIKSLERVPHLPSKQAESLLCSAQNTGSNGLGKRQPHSENHE